MDGDFFIKLLVAFGGLSGLIIGILAWNKDRFKILVGDGAVQRKEVAEVLEKLYTDLRQEMKDQREEHKREMEAVKTDHKTELENLRLSHNREITNLYDIIKKKDIIIRELIYRLPPEARAVVEAKVVALEEQIATAAQNPETTGPGNT